uniref:Uncharacterized protein n=1 Tax=Leersia perrieri TaxID=77586 RepID=A0A0D9XGB4_9ORYZ
MIHPKKLAQLAKKFQQKMASAGSARHTAVTGDDCCSTASSLAGKGHCAVYTADGARFEVPLPYLATSLFGELLTMSQEEFGFAGDDGRITLPCDSSVMEYVLCLLRRDASEEVEKAFLSSIARPCHNVELISHQFAGEAFTLAAAAGAPFPHEAIAVESAAPPCHLGSRLTTDIIAVSASAGIKVQDESEMALTLTSWSVGPNLHSVLGHLNRQERRATMISAKRLAQMAKKWQRMAALGRKRLTWTMAKEIDECCSSVAVKGHCIMYTANGRRFEVPLAFLTTTIFAELLRMSQEEFGFTSDGVITLPCDAEVMEYVMCLLKRNASEEVVRAFLSTIVKPCHYGFAPSLGFVQQVAASSY